MTAIYIEKGLNHNTDYQLHIKQRLNSTVFYTFSDEKEMKRYYTYINSLKGNVRMPFIRKIISNNVDLIKSVDSGVFDDHGPYYPNAMKKLRMGV